MLAGQFVLESVFVFLFAFFGCALFDGCRLYVYSFVRVQFLHSINRRHENNVSVDAFIVTTHRTARQCQCIVNIFNGIICTYM